MTKQSPDRSTPPPNGDLEVTRARLAAIVESSDDAIISKTLQGIITTWNQGAERIFGYTADEAIGQSVTMLIPADRPNEEPAIIDQVRRGERVDHYETVRRRKDGSLVDISLTVSPIRDEHGTIVGASKVARDISARKLAEAQMHKAREEAEAANGAKDAFLAMLGHELRNPLYAIRNAIAAAELNAGSRARALAIARRQTDQLTRIVDDLLDVARFARGNVVIRKQSVLLADIFERSVEAVRSLVEERGHSLAVSIPDEEISLEADSPRLQQAITNLSKQCDQVHGSWRGAVIVGRAPRRRRSHSRPGQWNRYRARDTRAAFEPFVQASRSIDRAEGGLGLGLALVRRVMELHGGEVEARSPGRGGGSSSSSASLCYRRRLPSRSLARPPGCPRIAVTPRG